VAHFGGWHGSTGFHGAYRGGWYGHGWDRYRRGWGFWPGWYGLGVGLGYPWYGYYPSYSSFYSDNAYPDTYNYGAYPEMNYAPSYSETVPEYDLYSSPPSGYVSTSPVGAATESEDAHVRVLCPAGAQVWFENQLTNQQGAVRYFESPPLKPGQEYVYHVQADWQQNGQHVSQTRDVHVHSGDSVTVTFTNPASENSREAVPAPAASAS
jgi:uncharacterized protein (TIGR03000 family)